MIVYFGQFLLNNRISCCPTPLRAGDVLRARVWSAPAGRPVAGAEQEDAGDAHGAPGEGKHGHFFGKE
jgi:hypothetical protein